VGGTGEWEGQVSGRRVGGTAEWEASGRDSRVGGEREGQPSGRRAGGTAEWEGEAEWAKETTAPWERRAYSHQKSRKFKIVQVSGVETTAKRLTISTDSAGGEASSSSVTCLPACNVSLPPEDTRIDSF